MKRSKRLIRNTIFVCAGIVVLHVGVSRLSALDGPAPVAQRTPAEQLGSLRDFNAIEVNGDFSLDVVQEASYSVAFTPADASQGSFSATMRGDTLVLRGFRNAQPSRVRVALPVLSEVHAEAVAALSVSGFDGDSVSLRIQETPLVTLRNNGVRRWHIASSGEQVGELKVDRPSLDAGKVDVSGRLTLTALE